MTKNSHPVEGPDGFVYQCRLPLSGATLDMVAGLIRGHLKKIRSRWRKLPPGRIALIVLAVLRHDQRLSDITTRLREAGLGALADLGFVGLDDDPDDPVIVTGRKATRGHPLTDAQKEANRLVSRERAAIEHGFADLKN
ncbi:hypothetical protein [Streptomyces sp. NPDC056188]|uniref:hypothetical protein n=1 Tax=Streptomyces sp. NPDC056188 TaxID=3345740 RepID=UPI0035E0E399